MSKSISNILIIGSGITGSSIANILNKNIRNKIKLSIFDKGYSPGGRMSRSYNKNKLKSIGVGFKNTSIKNTYFCKSEYDMSCDSLLNNKLITSTLIGNKLTYLPTTDYQDIINFINKDNLIDTKCKVFSINKHNDKWVVKSDKGIDYFELIIFTIPTRQIFEIDGNFMDIIKIDPKYQNLLNVKYESNFALGLFYDKFLDIKSTTKYLPDCDIIDSFYIENKNDYSTVTIHTKDRWTKENINLDKDKVISILKNKVNEYVPNLNNKNHQDYIFKKWKYSKVKENTEVDKKNKAIIVGDNELPIIIAGDGICGNGYENCVASAMNSYKLLNQFILK